MRIAMTAPLVESVPPTLYGGTERVVSLLTEELVRRGHEVTLFASGDSRTAARLVPVSPKGLRLDDQIKDYAAYTLVGLGEAYNRANEFDLMRTKTDADWHRFIKVVDEADGHDRLAPVGPTVGQRAGPGRGAGRPGVERPAADREGGGGDAHPARSGPP